MSGLLREWTRFSTRSPTNFKGCGRRPMVASWRFAWRYVWTFPGHAKLLAQRHSLGKRDPLSGGRISGGQIWVEKVQIGTSAPETTSGTNGMADSPIGEIASLN